MEFRRRTSTGAADDSRRTPARLVARHVGTHAAIRFFQDVFDFPATSANTFAAGGLTAIGSTLYGTTSGAYTTSNGYGTIYSLSTDGSNFQTLHTFDGTDGANPNAALTVIGSTLYGTTTGSRTGQAIVNYGSVFSIAADGSSYQTLHAFSGDNTPGFTSGLTDVNGALTGTGPVENGLAIYSIAPNGTNFQSTSYTTGNGGGIGVPPGNVTQVGSTLYGTATGGGLYNDGVAYSVNTNGSNFQILHSFATPTGNPAIVDGTNPTSDVTVVGSKLFGATFGGGTSNDGTLFSMNLDGTGYQVLHQFNGADGDRPSSLLAIGSTLYGVAGTTLFSLNTDGSNFRVLENWGTSANGAGRQSCASRHEALWHHPIRRRMAQGEVFSYQLPGPTTATVDQTQSVLSLSGTWSGAPIVAQSPGSLSTHATGTLSLDLLDPAHPALLPGGSVTLVEQPGPFQPGGLPANFAGTVSPTGADSRPLGWHSVLDLGDIAIDDRLAGTFRCQPTFNLDAGRPVRVKPAAVGQLSL